MAHTAASRRIGQTPEAIRQLPLSGGGPSASSLAGADSIDGMEGNGGEDKIGGAPAAQRRFTRLMARVVVEGSQIPQDQETKPQQAPAQPEGGMVWAIPPPLQVQMAGCVSAPAMYRGSTAAAGNFEPSKPKTTPADLATIPRPEETDRPSTSQPISPPLPAGGAESSGPRAPHFCWIIGSPREDCRALARSSPQASEGPPTQRLFAAPTRQSCGSAR